MNKDQKDKWESYCQAENDRIRTILLTKLEQFISLLLKSKPEEYEEWVFKLSSEVVDQGREFPIRMPLLEKIIIPILYQGCKSQKPGCARWLAGFSQYAYNSKHAQNILGSNFSEITYLRLALEHEPSDYLTKKKLTSALAWQLDYSIHEIPSGVLWGNNAASIKQCAELYEELSEFKLLASEIGEHKKYQELIDDCSLHFSEYPKYLSQSDKFDTYKEYLSIKNIKA